VQSESALQSLYCTGTNSSIAVHAGELAVATPIFAVADLGFFRGRADFGNPTRTTGVPRGKVRGFKPPYWIFRIFLIVCLQNILSTICSYTHWTLHFLRENVENCTLISFCFSFWGTSSVRPPGPAQQQVNPLHCKILGTPMTRTEGGGLGECYASVN